MKCKIVDKSYIICNYAAWAIYEKLVCKVRD